MRKNKKMDKNKEYIRVLNKLTMGKSAAFSEESLNRLTKKELIIVIHKLVKVLATIIFPTYYAKILQGKG